MEVAYFKTADRHPTASDADPCGYVLVWYLHRTGYWTPIKWESVQGELFPYWQPQPPPPKSASDAAFEEFLKVPWQGTPPRTDSLELRKAIWDAGIAWQKEQSQWPGLKK